jgi:multidrug efflux pump subunit AcrA (membrane-fusion protein)
MRWKLLLVAALIAVPGAVYLLFGKTDPTTPKILPDVRVAKVTRGPLQRTMRLTGVTSARDFVNIVAPQLRGPETGSALVLLKLVKPGAFVKKGELIAEIDGQSTADHVDDVADYIRQADADINKRKSEQQIELETLQQTLRQAKSDMEKARLDAKTTPLLTDIERELLQLNAEQTAARYQGLLKTVADQKAAYAAEIRILELTKERQTRHHDRHAKDLRTFTIYAPMNGLAVMQQIWRGGEYGQVQEGDQIGVGQLFMKVVNPNSMQVEAKANQAVSSELRIGQKVKVHLDAFPGLELPGHVYSIGALASANFGQSPYVRNVPVNILVDQSDPKLIPDLSASGDVLIDEAQDVLSIPLTAVREENGKATVSLRQGDTFLDRAVTLGMRNNDSVTVLSGLQAGEEVKLLN